MSMPSVPLEALLSNGMVDPVRNALRSNGAGVSDDGEVADVLHKRECSSF